MGRRSRKQSLTEPGAQPAPKQRLSGAERDEIARADAEYDEGLNGIRYLEHGGRSIRAAALLYREILRQIERDGYGARRPHRPVVGRARKAALLARAVIGA